MGDGPRDLKEAIKQVMSHRSSGELASMGMYDFDKGFKPISSYALSFDSPENQLEPSYYWLLDWLGERGWDLQKIVDNFMASPGSGQFSEMNMKATKMQEEGMKILGGMNQVIKSVLNLIYDLKEFELRLLHYDDAKSKDAKRKEEGMLALKQIWLDNVDLKRGRGSIHQMAVELGFTTIREVFMMANSVDDLKKINKDEEGGLINDQVMRILIPRVGEFLKWIDYSEKEMRKRFSIERNYLKSQVETVKLYSAWMKPYLAAAEKLRQKGFDKDSALVNSFSTSMFELQLFGKKKIGVDDRFSGYKSKRDYYSVMIIKLVFRGHVGQRVTQKGDYGFGMGGKINIDYDCYTLNDDELAAAEKLLDKSDMEKSMEFSLDVAGDALKDLQEDLDYFLKSKEERDAEEVESKKGEKKTDDINPFAALFGFGEKKAVVKKKDEYVIIEAKDIKSDNFVERVMRADAATRAAVWLYYAYDIYKKAHRMASVLGDGFDTHDEAAIEELSEGGNVGFGDIFKSRDAN
jgi:hypothetical protein